MKMNLKDNLYRSTSNSIWVCLVEGRFLMSKRGKTGWMRKSDAALAFKYSDYWEFIKHCTQQDHKAYHKVLDDKYKDLLKRGVVKFVEIKPIPEWFNI